MRRAVTRPTYSTSERPVARRADRFQRILLYLWWFGPSQRDCYKGKGKGKGFSNDGGYGKGYGKGRPVLGVGRRSMSSRIARRTNVQQVEEDVPEILFIGNVQNKEALGGW